MRTFLQNVAKDILANESDAEMKEMAREQLAENEAAPFFTAFT